MKRLLGNLLTSVVAIGLFLAMAESAFWFISPPPKPPFPKGMFESATEGWRLTPSFTGLTDNRVDFHHKQVTADDKGRRLVPAAPASAPHRLWLLGDSQTFGHGLSDEETWANRLQEEFNARNHPIKVINLGVPAINVDQYLARIRHLAAEVQPGDHVLVGLSWNDLVTPQQVEGDSIQLVEGYLVNAKPQASAESVHRRVILYDVTGIAVPPLQDLKTVLEFLSNTSALAHFIYPRAKAVYYRYRSVRPLESMVASKVPEANFFMLSQIQEIVHQRGASFTVMSLPDKIFFEDAAYNVYSVNGRDFPQQNYPGYLIAPLCDKFKIRCLDSFEVLHQHQNDPVAYGQDGHYNPRGAQLIAQWLAPLVRPSP